MPWPLPVRKAWTLKHFMFQQLMFSTHRQSLALLHSQFRVQSALRQSLISGLLTQPVRQSPVTIDMIHNKITNGWVDWATQWTTQAHLQACFRGSFQLWMPWFFPAVGSRATGCRWHHVGWSSQSPQHKLHFGRQHTFSKGSFNLVSSSLVIYWH